MDKCDIFISYSRRDKYQVDKIVDVLKFRGYKVWIDIDGIESGEAFRKTIVEAIENSSIMLFFSSDASNKSKWTTKEISLGVEYNKYIIPIKLDKASYNKSIIFDLIDLDYIDMSEERLVEASVQKLMRTIISKIGTRDYIDSDNYASNIIDVPNVSIHEEQRSIYESKTFLHKSFAKDFEEGVRSLFIRLHPKDENQSSPEDNIRNNHEKGIIKGADSSVEMPHNADVAGNRILTAFSKIGNTIKNGVNVENAVKYLHNGNYDKAFAILNMLVKLNNPIAQFYLGWMYEKGFGTLRNLSEAYKWYKKSADQGYKDADAALERLK